MITGSVLETGMRQIDTVRSEEVGKGKSSCVSAHREGGTHLRTLAWARERGGKPPPLSEDWPVTNTSKECQS